RRMHNLPGESRSKMEPDHDCAVDQRRPLISMSSQQKGASHVRGNLHGPAQEGTLARLSRSCEISQTEARGRGRLHRQRAVRTQKDKRSSAFAVALARRKGGGALAHAG